MEQIKINLENRGLHLEGILELPGEVPGPLPGAVLCHPHPVFGGNMDDHLLTTVGKALLDRSIAVLRFNFRGVGESEGTYARGLGEQEDARAALLYLAGREELDPGRISIMGYSFGGMIAMSVGSRENAVKAIAAVSPVVPTGLQQGCTKPKLVVCGTEDNMVNSSMILQEASQMEEPKNIEVIPGADHFWRGMETKVAGLVAGFLETNLK